MKKTEEKALAKKPAQLTKKQLEELAEVERRAIAVKCAVSDTTEQILVLENQRRELYGQLDAAKNEYLAKLKKFVSLLGLDPEDQTVKHDVNLQTGVVTSTDVEQQKP